MPLHPRLLIQIFVNFRIQTCIDQVLKMIALNRKAFDLQYKTVLQRIQFPMFRNFVGSGEKNPQGDRLGHAVLIEFFLIDDRQKDIQNR